MNTFSETPSPQLDCLLVGAGIMSSTLAVILKELQPDLKIAIYEKLESAAQESSNGWNNAGTGHAALCELNYTPESSDGKIDISKALAVNTEFDLSRQLWAYLVAKGAIKDPQVHSLGTALQLCARPAGCCLFKEAARSTLSPSLLSRNGILRRQKAN